MTESMSGGEQQDDLREVVELLRARSIRYPVANRVDFVEQMCAVTEPVVFRGQAYDTGFAANLVPEFLFPIESEDDVLTKVTELLVARGFLPIVSLQEER